MKTLLILIVFIPFIGFSQDEKEIGTPLLEDYAIMHKDIQLNNENKNLIGYKDVEYVTDICNCALDVINTIDEWKARVNAIPSSYQKEKSRVRIAIGVSQPNEGEIIIIYRSFDQKKYAYLSILFDGNDRIDNKSREKLIRTYDLINLKRKLTSNMKCMP